MKKTLFFGLMAAALGFTACSSDDDLSVSNDNNQKKGMVLRATVEQPAETRAAISDAWKFAFATSDKVSVTNTAITDTYYTFTNYGTQFKSEDAQATETDATWYAYFPSNAIDLTGQSGAKADVANMYALAGSTATATTGKDGLNITMSPKVAILVIDNQKGSIDINVKNGSSTWVIGLAANEDGFTVSTATSKQSILNATTTGTYYVAVPAGVQLAVKDGNKTIKSTEASGLTAGRYYNLTIEPIKTIADVLATINGFPDSDKQTNVPTDAWVCENVDRKAFTLKNTALCLYAPDSNIRICLLTSDVEKKDDGSYTAAVNNGNFTFNVNGGILTSFKFTATNEKHNNDGTYSAPNSK